MSELHEVVTRNLRVLKAVRGLEGNKVIATMLDVDATTISNKMNGKRQWTLDDIEKLARGFRIEPTSLIGDGRDFLDPNLKATGTQGGSSAYVPAERSAVIIQFPQVNRRGRELLGLAPLIQLNAPSAYHADPRPSLTVAG